MNSRSGSLIMIIATVVATILVVSGVTIVPSLQASRPLSSIKIGAIYPLKAGGPPARDEYHGLRVALTMVNRRGGVLGHSIRLRLENVAGGDQSPRAVARLHHWHAIGIVGSESSLVGIPASEAAQASHVFYLEAGAVATMLTAKGLPDVFRTVTTAQTLGRGAARFAARTIAPRLHIAVHRLRLAVVYIRDAYGRSVGAAQIAETRRLGMHLVKVFPYNFPGVNFRRLVENLKRARPNVVLVAAYRPDAIEFRRETIRERLHVGAMIGTSSSFCMMGFARALGRGAVGLFASDKPDVQINPRALSPAARRLRSRANSLYRRRYRGSMSGPAVAGFVAGWVLFHEILPRAQSFSTGGLRRAALSLNLPYGSQINGGGVYFARASAHDGGQNLRATSVIWQWQHPDQAVIVAPAPYATGNVRFIPLSVRR